MFEQDSRYYTCEDLAYQDENGNTILYKARRFIRQPEDFEIASHVTVKEGQRLDQVSYSTLGKPSFYWKIGDANLKVSLREMETPGSRLRIPLSIKAK